MTTAAFAVLLLRLLASALALANLWWTRHGFFRLLHGYLKPPEIYMSVVFFMSVAILVFQAAYFAGQTDQWRLLAYSVLTLTMGLALFGHIRGAASKARDFYRAYDHLEVTAAMVDLAKVDSAAANRMAAECRRLYVAAVVSRA